MLCESQSNHGDYIDSPYLARLSKMAQPTSMAKQSRRSVRSLSVQEKVQAIDRVHEGESKASVARDIGVPESTLRGWCKGEEKLRGIVARSGANNTDNAGSSNDESQDKSTADLIKGIADYKPKLSHEEVQGQKRDFSSIQESLYQSTVGNKYAKLENNDSVCNNYAKLDGNEVPPQDTSQRTTETPLNFSKNSEELTSFKLRATNSPPSAPSKDMQEKKSESRRSDSQSLPALAAIASAMSSKSQLLYNAYTNGFLGDMFPKQEAVNKPLDYSTKIPPRAPRPDVNDALLYWLQSQREQATLPMSGMSPLEARTADSSSWFWKWYKNYGVLPQVPTTQPTKTSNNTADMGPLSDEEDEPPATAAEAVRHGEKFLRWLECCSDPSITALQILQFRYLLNNVKECAERRARQVRTKARSRRK